MDPRIRDRQPDNRHTRAGSAANPRPYRPRGGASPDDASDTTGPDVAAPTAAPAATATQRPQSGIHHRRRRAAGGHLRRHCPKGRYAGKRRRPVHRRWQDDSDRGPAWLWVCQCGQRRPWWAGWSPPKASCSCRRSRSARGLVTSLSHPWRMRRCSSTHHAGTSTACSTTEGRIEIPRAVLTRTEPNLPAATGNAHGLGRAPVLPIPRSLSWRLWRYASDLTRGR